MKDLSLITCSYETPVITETMLKSFKFIHPDVESMNIVIMENSRDEDTRTLLDSYGISYTKNPGGTHSKSMDIAFDNCKTKYALIVDTDIIFRRSIEPIYKMIKDNEIDLCGIKCGDRGGYKLMPRIHPWFMFINIEKVKQLGIKFHDEVRINKTSSQGFYKNIPLNDIKLDIPMYDVGSTFYEDAKAYGLRISDTPIIQNWFHHYEGSSWQRKSGHPGFEQLGGHVWTLYQQEISKVDNVDIRGYYKY